MPLIPIPSAGNAIARPPRTANVQPPETFAPAAQAIGQALTQTGAALQREQAEFRAEVAQREEQAARLVTGAAGQALSNEARDLTFEIGQALERGEIGTVDVSRVWEKRYQQAYGKHWKTVPEARREEFNVVSQSVQANGWRTLRETMSRAGRTQARAELNRVIDLTGKAFGAATSDDERAKIHERLDASAEAATSAGVPLDQVQAALQSAKDSQWFVAAQQQAMLVGEDLDGLASLEAAFAAPDGPWATRLDADKRARLVESVRTDRRQLEQRIALNVERRERAAERAIDALQTDVVTGIPLKAQRWEEVARAVEGTSSAAALKDLAQQHDRVQDLLRRPVNEQQREIAEMEAGIAAQGSDDPSRDQALIGTLRRAVAANLEELRQAPLLVAQKRTGEPIEPIGVEALTNPQGMGKVIAQMREREATVRAMQAQYGAQIPMRVFLPHEAEQIAATVGELPPGAKLNALRLLRSAFDDPKAYEASVLQAFGDDPVTALAGVIASREHPVEIENNWLSENAIATPREIARTLLEGQAIIRSGKAPGNGAALLAPARKLFDAAFVDKVGDLYRGRPSVMEKDLAAAYAYYTGAAARSGRLSGDPSDIDSGLVENALSAVVGSVVDVNGHGSAKAPWGMGKDAFGSRLRAGFEAAVEAEGLPAAVADQWEDYGVTNLTEGLYAVTVGGRPVLGPKSGRPVVIDLRETPARAADGTPLHMIEVPR